MSDFTEAIAELNRAITRCVEKSDVRSTVNELLDVARRLQATDITPLPEIKAQEIESMVRLTITDCIKLGMSPDTALECVALTGIFLFVQRHGKPATLQWLHLWATDLRNQMQAEMLLVDFEPSGKAN